MSNHLELTLSTSSSLSLHKLEQTLLAQQSEIEHWLLQQWKKTPPPITCSVDLRNAGFKLTPVDTNLFPAGFNNLNANFLPLCIQAMQATLSQQTKLPKNILLIPESHTRNPFYLESLYVLHNILVKAGFTTRIGTLRPEITEPFVITLSNQRTLVLEPITREETHIRIHNFLPDLILLNNDLSNGIPEILTNLTQPIAPPPQLGWSHRLKSNHFAHYEVICHEFAQFTNLDPWLINPLFRNCGEIDFMTRQGEDCLLTNAENLFKAIQRKYTHYGITQAPFLVIKADAGTYGMGVMTVKSIDELKQLNRKQRTRMAKTKGSRTITQIIIQEGVYTLETWGATRAPAEPVMYLIGPYVVGGFYRIHAERSSSENLNAPGMQFAPLAFTTCCNNPDAQLAPEALPNRFYVYSVIARLASLAAAREIEELAL